MPDEPNTPTPANPPVFPHHAIGHSGVTLRDHFAGQWLTTFRISAPPGMASSEIAQRCYAVADAMLAERAK